MIDSIINFFKSIYNKILILLGCKKSTEVVNMALTQTVSNQPTERNLVIKEDEMFTFPIGLFKKIIEIIGNWFTKTVATSGDSGYYTSTASPTPGIIYVSYSDLTSFIHNLKFAKSTDDGNTWSTQTIDSSGSVGISTSVASPASGTIYIAYADDTNDDLKFAKSTNDGTTWSTQTIDSTGAVGFPCSMDMPIPLGGNIYVAYNGGSFTLKVAKSTDYGNTWTTLTVPSTATGAVAYQVGLTSPIASRMYVAYKDNNTNDLKLAKSIDTGSTWTVTTIVSGGSSYPSITSDYNSGNIYISYRYNTTLCFAKSTDSGSTWTTQTIDSSGAVARYSSIACSSASSIYISYSDDTNDDLKIARSKDYGNTWTIETVDSEGLVGHFTSIASPNNNTAYISYYDETNTDLKFAKYVGSKWVGQNIDSNYNSGSFGMTMPTSTTMYAGYAKGSNLMLAKSTNTGETWNTITTGTTGSISNVSTISPTLGTIYVGYDVYDNPLRIIKFSKSTDDGSTWNTVTVDSSGTLNSSATTSPVSGTVYMSYRDYSGAPTYKLKFAKSIDNGNTWTTKTIATSGTIQESSITSPVSGTIYVVYWNTTLKFAKSTDDGNTWSITDIDAGKNPSILSFDYGVIYIAYSNNSDILKFAKSTDYGSTWSIKSVDANGYATSAIHQAMTAPTSGTIYITYADYYAEDVMIAKSVDSGDTWTIEAVDSTGQIGLFSTVASKVPDKAYVMSVDYANDILKFYKYV